MRPRRSHAPDSAQQHRDWLSLIEVSGPFLSLPVLRSTWSTLDALDKPTKEKLRLAHATWQENTASGQRGWIDYILGELLEWGDALRWAEDEDFDALSMDVAEHDARVTPAFALVDPGEDAKPRTTQVLGLICAPGTQPTARIKGETWAATPVDRLARLCRHHEVQLGLATDGRWLVLVSAPRGKVTTTAVFDTVAWNEAAELDVARAFVSMLRRSRFYGVPDNEKLVELLRKSEDAPEEITEALGVQVRQAVELLVAAIGRADTAQRDRGEKGLDVDACEVYRGAVTVMMRIVFCSMQRNANCCPPTAPCTPAPTRLAGCARSSNSRRKRAAKTTWNTAASPGTGCLPCSTRSTTASATPDCGCMPTTARCSARSITPGCRPTSTTAPCCTCSAPCNTWRSAPATRRNVASCPSVSWTSSRSATSTRACSPSTASAPTTSLSG
ncbi:hypothetical protein [Amycolatopsis sp. NBC_01307]|uniref:hypothetical protein n=1 Tax=Amycolatopsis sp. NBC_01307 TaxID=2903561 RepID=UPI002E14530B